MLIDKLFMGEELTKLPSLADSDACLRVMY